MKAVVYDDYGSPDVLRLEDVDLPVVKDRDVLVRVLGASVNPGDWYLLRGIPYVLRLSAGLRAPKDRILGRALAGRVETVGSGVAKVRPGDEVYAEVARGAFAEFARVPEDALAPKPPNLTFEQAAAVPLVGVTALRALRDIGRVRPGEKVLITGASGGVGTFAVQIAKSLGADVTGVSSSRNVELVRSIGADHVVDYTQEDFTRSSRRYDLILDNVGRWTLADLRRALTPRGTLIPNSNTGGDRWIGAYLTRGMQALLWSPFVSQRLRPMWSPGKPADLVALTKLIEGGAVTPVIDRTYPLDETSEALRHYGTGHTRGKVVITVGHGEG